jgi:hypothetical protein
VRGALAAWDAFLASPEGSHALAILKPFRNHVLAHTLDKEMKDIVPVVNDVFQFVDGALAAAPSLSLAFNGEDWDATSRQ